MEIKREMIDFKNIDFLQSIKKKVNKLTYNFFHLEIESNHKALILFSSQLQD